MQTTSASPPTAHSAAAAVIRDKGGPFLIERITLEAPRPDEVLVRLAGTGLCHTDLLSRDGVLPPAPPVVLGHEGSGVVEAVGAAVAGLEPGDHVVLAPAHCGTCRMCLTGHPMHCVAFPPLNLRGRRRDGSTAYRDGDGRELHAHYFGQSSLATHAVVQARGVVRVDRDAPLELLGPLGCGFQTGAGTVLEALRPPPGSSIAVFGAGAVGLAAVMAARIAGCTRIIAVDLHPHRLDLARELGATDVVPAEKAAAIGAETGGVDFAVDAVGLPETLRAAVGALAMGGTAALVGSAGTGREVSLGMVGLMGRTVKGVLEGDVVPALFIPRLLELHRAGLFPFDRLIRTYPFADVEQAADDAEKGRTVKPVLVHG
ncbi:MAG TPA: NAD(P)-dependent alcohol dehydrogenase [Yinghuangia sp.]|nr:NAD(P)-dependent alcohol dehydrogenase [Yinghuangia sp.]